MIAGNAATRVETGASRMIRVMIVDDSVVVRSLVRRWLSDEPGVEVVGAYRTGREALANVVSAAPDVIVLDIEMPDMDGVTALPELLKLQPDAAVIMASTLTRRNAEISLRCLSLGAADYLPKPELHRDPGSASEFQRDLIAKVRGLGERRARRRSVKGTDERAMPSNPVPASRGTIHLRPFSSIRPRVLAIGASTGGPQALVEFFKVFQGRDCGVPILVTQHMPPNFTAVLAEHLGRASGLPAEEGHDGDAVVPGHIYVAPGGFHMTVMGTAAAPRIRLHDGPPVNFCRPAVDPMFESLIPLYGRELLAVVLTGMGHDGARGARMIADAGGNVIAQDEATSVVWGMPGATALAGACAAVLPLHEIGPKAAAMIQGSGI